MHNESQIQDNRDRRDASTLADFKGESKYCCKFCKKQYDLKKSFEKHIEKCSRKFLDHLIGVDWVQCFECSFRSKSLTSHIKNYHHLTVKDYLQKHPSSILNCKSSNEKKSKANKENGAWIKRAKDQGKNIDKSLKKMSLSVSQSVMKNLDERVKRSKRLSDLNRRQDFRERSSISAKITSARREIQLKRALALHKWRQENPDVFYEKCIQKINFSSKPERILFNFLLEVPGFSFRKNQFVKSNFFSSKSKRKQIDIADKSKRIYIEFDGIFHFKKIFTQERFDSAKRSDLELDNHIQNHNWTLIRVSYENFSYKVNDFSNECKRQILEILTTLPPGVHRIGSFYKDLE